MGEYSKDFYAKHLSVLKDAIRACSRPVDLIVVSKTQDLEKIKLLYGLGVRDFGENRVQELQDKARELRFPDIRWHFIGHLQTNKVKTLLKIPNLKSIHSIDSLKLLKALWSNGQEIKTPLDVFLEVNISGEKEKGGFEDYASVREALEWIQGQVPDPANPLRLVGLMGMGAIRTEDFIGDARRCFTRLSDMRGAIREDYHLPLKLSMGMSEDWKVALECGSDVLRVGSYIFR